MAVPQGAKFQIFIITYFLFISLVPGSPSYYRLLVDTIGSVLSLISLIFLELYLKSRPLNQKNILNSQLHLIVYFHIAFTTRSWIASIAGSIFRNMTTLMLDSYPGVFMALLLPRHYSIALVTAYCTFAASKLLLIISPVTFQNISSFKGFRFSFLAALLIPSLDRVFNQIKCGYCTTKEDHPFYNTMIIREELGMPNYVFKGTVVNATTTEEEGRECEAKVKPCAFFPTLMVVVILMITLEMIKFMLIIKRRKINNKIHNSKLSPPRQSTNPKNLALTNPSHILQPVIATHEVVLSPGDLERGHVVHGSNIIYINPSPGDEIIAATTMQTIALIEDSASIVALTSTTTEGNGATSEYPTDLTIGSSSTFEKNAASAEETAALAEEIASSTEEIVASTEEVAASTQEIVASTEELPASREEIAASTQEIASSTQEIAASSEEEAASTEEIRDTSLSGTIKYTVKIILFRAGTLSHSLFGFLMCIIILVPMNVFTNDKHLPFFNRLLSSIARYFAYVLPWAWILFDRDIRIYTFLKLRNMRQRYFN